VSEDFPSISGGFVAGSRIGGYLLEEQIGQGGMAVVFRALDERLGRPVALKILAPSLAADEAFRQRFIRESRAAAAVDDPHIIPVFEAGEADGVLFIAMRYVRGGDVRSLMFRDGALPAARVAGIVSPVASALDAAHAAGLVHRDIKPANMLIDVRQGRPAHVYLADFGLSKEALGSVGLTGSGQFLGTVDYAAPEQVEGHPVDGRADQYALGCAAFAMLSGEPPFRRDQGMAVLLAHLSEPPPSVASRRKGLPAALDPVFARVLAKRPDGRYGSCREFGDALRGALGIAPYDVEPQVGHQDTEVAWAAPGLAAGAGAIAAEATEAAARRNGGSGLPTAPPGTPRLDQRRPSGQGGPRDRTPAARRWPIVVASAAVTVAAVAVAFSLKALTSHSPMTAQSPGNSPAITAPRTASAPSTTPGSSPSAVLPAAGGDAASSSAPPPPNGPDNIWIAQLASVAVTQGTARLDSVLARIQLDIPGAQVLSSSDYASLRPGYWVVYYPGPFSNGTQALAYCAAHGRTTSNLCIGRFLSHNSADYYYRCYPPATNSPPACFRS
jgi:serine/threonine-protein kinase